MALVLVGLSHHKAPIEVREKLSVAEQALPGALSALMSRVQVSEAVLLSTCNRMEAYLLSDGLDEAAVCSLAMSHFAAFHDVPEDLIAQYVYRKSEQEVITHLARVAAGLDSLVLGEAQILGQVKSALRQAESARSAGPVLSRLFQQAIRAGKRVQAETDLGKGGFSVGHAAVKLASSIFNLTHARALILGAGKTSELTARHLVAAGVKFVVVANRTFAKAESMAARLGGQAVHYDRFEEEIVTADIVISSTAAPHPIVHRKSLLPLLKRRKGKPLFLIDIAVPRDIDPDVNELDNVFLYNIDDLQAVVSDEARGRAAETESGEVIVSEEAANFLIWYRERRATPVIAQLRGRFHQIATNRLNILKSLLGPQSDRDWKIIETQMLALMDEVARNPILRLKRATDLDGETENAGANQYDLLAAAREIFGLDEVEARSEGLALAEPDAVPPRITPPAGRPVDEAEVIG